MEKIKILTERGLKSLILRSEDVSLYENGISLFEDLEIGKDYVFSNHLVEYPELKLSDTDVLQTDYNNALLLYNKLIEIPFEVKSNPYFQILLLHDKYYNFNLKRWYKEDVSKKQMSSLVRRKFFLKEPLRRHSIFGEFYIVSLLRKEKDFRKLIEIAIQFPDHTSQIFERSLGRSSKILASYLRVLNDYSKYKKFIRKPLIRLQIGKRVNDYAGAIMLDFLTPKEIKKSISEIFKLVITNEKNSN